MSNYFTHAYRYRSWRFNGRIHDDQTLSRLPR